MVADLLSLSVGMQFRLNPLPCILSILLSTKDVSIEFLATLKLLDKLSEFTRSSKRMARWSHDLIIHNCYKLELRNICHP